MSYTIQFKTRWSDFDANRHMRHTAYNDYAAEARLRFLTEKGFGLELMSKSNVGPILFSENTIFRKEILIGEDISLELFLDAASEKGERFKIRHHIYRSDGQLAAVISVYLAWIDIVKRKLTTPPVEILETLQYLEKSENFEVIEL